MNMVVTDQRGRRAFDISLSEDPRVAAVLTVVDPGLGAVAQTLHLTHEGLEALVAGLEAAQAMALLRDSR
jgi:hypothetical protein